VIGPRLPKADFNALVTEVARRVTPADLGKHVTACGHSVDDIVPPGSMTMPQVTQRVLKSAENDEWLGELLDLLGASPAGPTLADLCRRCRVLWFEAVLDVEALAPNGQPRGALMLFNHAPFVNRSTERPLIDDVVAFAGRRALVVRGEKGVGKSHLEQFARHLVEARPGTRMATLRMEEIDASAADDKGVALIGAMDLMSALVSRMGLAGDPSWDVLAQEQRQAGKLVDWLVGKTQAFAAAGTQWVIVIDTANHPKVGPGALELISRLLMAAARSDLVDTCLIVLALPKEVDVPPAVAGNVDEATLLPLTPDEVRSFITELAAALRRTLAAADIDALEAHATRGLVFPLDRAGMDTLSRRLAEMHDTLLRAA
jgi:hypothetical protein